MVVSQRQHSTPKSMLALGLVLHTLSCGRIGYDYLVSAADAQAPARDGALEVAPAMRPEVSIPPAAAVDAALGLDADTTDAGSTSLDASQDGRGDAIDLAPWLAAGWTTVFSSTFDSQSPEFPTTPVTMCGEFGSLLGGAEVLGLSASVNARFSLPAHTEIHVLFDFVAIDSWDEELVYLNVDRKRVTDFRCGKSGEQLCNRRSNQCGGGVAENFDGQVRISATAAHTAKTADVVIGATLDQGLGDESWGLNNLAILVR